MRNEFNSQTDGLIASSSKKIRPLMIKIQKQMPVTYLFDHQGKVNSKDIQELVPQIRGTNSFVVPNYALFEQFQLETDERSQGHLELGYPYGAHMRLGNSNEERQLIIYWNIGDANEDASVVNVCDELMDYYLNSENIGLIISTLEEKKANIVAAKITRRILKQFDFLIEEDGDALNKILRKSNNVKEVQSLINQIKIRLWKRWEIEHPVVNEKIVATIDDAPQSETIDWEKFTLTISSIAIREEPRDYQIFDDLARARILVDMGEPYDARMQFNAISAGIPQINKIESPFVIDRANGWIVKEGHSLTQGLEFYLGKLGNWNVALVNTAKYMEQLEFRRQADWWERRMHYE
ncbi:MAG: accessory Sec system glycosyltransferase Asp1 [Pediococcus acidilactici]|nr:accessory Sec system glycosyltransferase Asp1 [Pediococcus acidilactici]